MTLAELKELGLAGAAQVDSERVQLMWASGYWDGPLDGLARIDDMIVWFCLAEESDDDAVGWFRRFWLIRLTPEQLAIEQCRHQDFQRFVGTHFDYDEDTRRHPDQVRPQSEWPKFYDKYDENNRGPGDLSQNEVVGWFQW